MRLRDARHRAHRAERLDVIQPITEEPVDLRDAVCKHGTALDVHCCNCHSGFLFDAASCVCFDDLTEVCPNCMGRGEVVREDGSDHQVEAVCLECGGRGWLQ